MIRQLTFDFIKKEKNAIPEFEELQDIASYYKEKFNVLLDTTINSYNDVSYNFKTKSVQFDIGYIAYGYITKDLQARAKAKTKRDLVIFALLHEIYHAIDWQKNYELTEKEFESADKVKYYNNRDYHHSMPWEIRADDFAREEMIKWI